MPSCSDLADKAGDEALFPRELAKRADIARWQFWEIVHFNRAFGALAFETLAKPKLGLTPSDPSIVAAMHADLARFAPVLEAHLADRDFMVGDRITLADYSVITFEGYRPVVPFDFAPYPNISRYFDRMRQVDSWARTAPAWQRSTAKAA